MRTRLPVQISEKTKWTERAGELVNYPGATLPICLARRLLGLGLVKRDHPLKRIRPTARRGEEREGRERERERERH